MVFSSCNVNLDKNVWIAEYNRLLLQVLDTATYSTKQQQAAAYLVWKCKWNPVFMKQGGGPVASLKALPSAFNYFNCPALSCCQDWASPPSSIKISHLNTTPFNINIQHKPFIRTHVCLCAFSQQAELVLRLSCQLEIKQLRIYQPYFTHNTGGVSVCACVHTHTHGFTVGHETHPQQLSSLLAPCQPACQHTKHTHTDPQQKLMVK